MDPVSAVRVRAPIDNADELERPDDPPPPAARDWDVDSSAARDFARNAIPQDAKHGTAARELAVNLDENILYLGMTSSAPIEIAALRSTGSSVTVVPHATRDDHVEVGARDFDLAQPSDATAFAHAIGLTGAQADRVATILQAANAGSRDELAEIARSWAVAEQGGSAPSRLVLSGHSAGSSVYGMGGDGVSFAQLRELAHAMPRGAGHVEDIQLSGCNTGLNATADAERATWTAAFPRLKTTWGYQGACPLAPSADMKAWEHATRGRATAITLDAAQIAGNVSVGSRGKVDSWVVRLPLGDLQKRLSTADRRFAGALAGKGEMQSGAYDAHGSSALHEDYETYKGAVARNDVPAADKARYDAKAEQVLRLRYWNEVRTKFAEAHGKEIEKGLEAAHMPCPDIAKLSREKAVLLTDEFDRRADTKHSPEIDRARDLLHALRDLDPKVIRQGWCLHAAP